MAFIEKTDFPASVHDDILNALTKGNDVGQLMRCVPILMVVMITILYSAGQEMNVINFSYA